MSGIMNWIRRHLIAFAAIAVLLAVVGIFGVVSDNLTQGQHAIGDWEGAGGPAGGGGAAAGPAAWGPAPFWRRRGAGDQPGHG